MGEEACWTISNILSSADTDIIQSVIDANIFPVLIDLQSEAELKTRKEIAYAINNALEHGTLEQIRYIIDQGVITSLCDLITVTDSEIIQVGLESLEHILSHGEEECQTSGDLNAYAVMLEDVSGGLDNIDSLQNHDSPDVSKKAVHILEAYYEENEVTQNECPNKWNSYHECVQFCWTHWPIKEKEDTDTSSTPKKKHYRTKLGLHKSKLLEHYSVDDSRLPYCYSVARINKYTF